MYALKTEVENRTRDFYNGKFQFGPYLPKLDDFSIVFIDSAINFGIITKRTFESGQIVAEIRGDIVNDIRQHTLQVGPDKHIHDPYFSGYISHSCDPNIRLEANTRYLIAEKNISHYERLCMDYSDSEDILYKNFQCNCGEKNCRGWITGKMDNNTK